MDINKVKYMRTLAGTQILVVTAFANVKKNCLLRVSLAVVCLCLASCVANDQAYTALLGSAETNPDEYALVGMWHRRSATLDGVVVNHNLLIRNNHTGTTKATADDPDPLLGWLTPEDVGGDLGEFNWSYLGNGLWQLKNAKGRTDDCRLSQGKMLRVFRNVSGDNHLIFTRPE